MSAPLDVHHVFRREQVLRPVDVGTEATAFGRQFPAARQREDLKPAAVGQNRAVPCAEAVQPSRPFEDVRSGTQVEVVGVAQNDLCADLLFQIAVEDAFDAPDGAHGHEDRGLDRSVVGRDDARSGRASGVGMLQVESHCGQR